MRRCSHICEQIPQAACGAGGGGWDRKELRRRKTCAGRVSWHSQTMSTRQPWRRRRRRCFRSFVTFRANFSAQNLRWVLWVDAILHPLCRCQKQPWTRTTALYLGRTMSGLPGREDTLSRKRYPAQCRRLRTLRSGPVFLPRILDMRSLRSEMVNVSIATIE